MYAVMSAEKNEKISISGSRENIPMPMIREAMDICVNADATAPERDMP